MANGTPNGGARLVGKRSAWGWVITAILILAVLAALAWAYARRNNVDTTQLFQDEGTTMQQDQQNQRNDGLGGIAPLDDLQSDPSQDQRTQQGSEPIRDFSQLFETQNIMSYLDRMVEVENVNVQQVVGPRTLWAGTSNQQKVFVYLSPNTQNDGTSTTGIQQNDNVKIMGRVQMIPSEEEMKNRWNLNDQQIQEVKKSGVYILAEEVTKQ